MSFPDPSQQPQWPQQSGQPGPGQPPQAGPGGPFPPGGPGSVPPGGPGGSGGYMPPGGPGGPGGPYGPGGPGGPGGPYGPYGHPSGGAVPPGGGGGGRKRWMIPAAAVLAVVVLGGAVWASVSLINFGGNQPETVLPGNTAAFAKIDLDIDGSQALEFLEFVEQLPDEVADEIDTDDGDMSEFLAEVISDNQAELDKGSVSEWIGDKAGAALWPTDSQEAANEAGYNGLGMAVALAVEDEEAASADLDQVVSENEDVTYEMVDGFAVLVSGNASLDDLNNQIEEHGTLDSADDFSADLSQLHSGILAAAWADLGAMSGIEDFESEFQTGMADGPTEISGRFSAGVHVDGSYLEVQSTLTDWSFDGSDMSWLADTETGSVQAIGQLPENTVMAFGASGLDSALTQAYDNGDLDSVIDNRDFQQMERELNSIGAHLPDGFGALLGSSTVFGVTGDASDGFFEDTTSPGQEPFVYRAEGADLQVMEDFVNDLLVGPYGQAPSISEEDGTVVVQEGAASTGTLADDAVFEQTMQEMDEAVVAGFFDLRQVLEAGVDAEDPEQWGAVGFAMTPSEDGSQISGELRWSPSGGE